MTSALFQPLQLRSLTLANRIVVSPMCQYSAVDGSATNWHVLHLGQMAMSGASLLILEATAVESAGKITRECLGLYSDENERALSRVLDVVREFSPIKIGIQLSHAGRKASMLAPKDGAGVVPKGQGGWTVVGPSGAPFAPDWNPPLELDRAGMDRVITAFVSATERCERLGIDLIELHGAHGYLLSSFLSPLANRRTDEYGGSIENRMRFPLEVFAAVRKRWPADKPLGIRINGSDWHPHGINPDEAVRFASELARLGCDFVDVSSGGNTVAPIPVGPGYQVPFAERVKRDAGLTTIAVGLIRDPLHADSIVVQGQADLIALGRGMINDPRWPWHAAEDLGAKVHYPVQYARGARREGVPSSNIIPVKAAKSS